MAEIRVLQKMDDITPKSIDFNYEEVKAYLESALAKYKGLVVTPASVREAKEVKAKINKTAKQIDEYRISLKKMYLAPFTEFEKKCKELVSMCNEVSSAIAEQTKAFDEDKRTAKMARLKAYFKDKAAQNGMTKNLDDLWTLVEKKAWGNVTYPEDTAMAEIDAFIAGESTPSQRIERLVTFKFTTTEANAKRVREFLDDLEIAYAEA